MAVLGSILFLSVKDVLFQFSRNCIDGPKERKEVAGEVFETAEIYVIAVPKQMIETKSIVTDPGALNSSHGRFCDIRNIFRLVIDLLRKRLNQPIQPFSVSAQVERVSSRLLEIKFSIITHPGYEWRRCISG